MSQQEKEEDFVEILINKEKNQESEEFVEVYVTPIRPQFCSPLLKELSARLPLGRTSSDETEPQSDVVNLSHLKRVRRQEAISEQQQQQPEQHEQEAVHCDEDQKGHKNDGTNLPIHKTQPKKRQKIKGKSTESLLLEVVLGSVATVNTLQSQPWLSDIVTKYHLKLEKRMLPGRPAQSLEELERFNTIWPTIYFHKQSEQHMMEELKLTQQEIRYMQWGMREAIQDAVNHGALHTSAVTRQNNSDQYDSPFLGAVICNPDSEIVVSRATEEHEKQFSSNRNGQSANDVVDVNPLVTPTLLAIQGISRMERNAAIGHGMESDAFRKGQYLCTGLDLFVTKEPDVFEAMACLHSRVRRVVFGRINGDSGGLGGSGVAVHDLPGTNHKFRVFKCGGAFFEKELANDIAG